MDALFPNNLCCASRWLLIQYYIIGYKVEIVFFVGTDYMSALVIQIEVFSRFGHVTISQSVLWGNSVSRDLLLCSISLLSGTRGTIL